MSKDIKDYLHLYLGCSCEFKPQHNLSGKYYGFVKQIPRIGTEVLMMVVEDDIGEAPENTVCYAFAPDIKPILRPLSDMTEEDLKQQEEIIAKYIDGFKVTDDDRKNAIKRLKDMGMSAMGFDDTKPEMIFEVTRLLLKQGFDLFGLIEAGLAIDKTKAPEQNQ